MAAAEASAPFYTPATAVPVPVDIPSTTDTSTPFANPFAAPAPPSSPAATLVSALETVAPAVEMGFLSLCAGEDVKQRGHQGVEELEEELELEEGEIREEVSQGPVLEAPAQTSAQHLVAQFDSLGFGPGEQQKLPSPPPRQRLLGRAAQKTT